MRSDQLRLLTPGGCPASEKPCRLCGGLPQPSRGVRIAARQPSRGLLKFHADRPSRFGLENHLAAMQREVRDFKPQVTVADPVTNLLTVGTHSDVRSMLTRIMDYLKMESITGLFTSLSPGRRELEETDAGISSLMDTWIVLSVNEENRSRRRWHRCSASRSAVWWHGCTGRRGSMCAWESRSLRFAGRAKSRAWC